MLAVTSRLRPNGFSYSVYLEAWAGNPFSGEGCQLPLPLWSNSQLRGRNINRLSVTYPVWVWLRTALPWGDKPSPGNLRHSGARILAWLALLMPAFSLPHRPRNLPVPLLPNAERSPTSSTYFVISSRLCSMRCFNQYLLLPSRFSCFSRSLASSSLL